MPTRRDFLLAASALAVPPGAPAAPSPAWAERPMRWAQLTLAEDDPGSFSAAFWLDYFRRIHSDAACLSAGGCVAYYPTAIPLHHRSKWLGSSDPFGELVAGCRKMSMAVVARIDPHAVLQEVHDAHPDWIAVETGGNRRRHWAMPERWVTCALGPYNFEFMTKVVREIVAKYRVDGIFANRWEGHGMCYCEHCRANFKAAAGHDLPRTADPLDPVRRDFIVWEEQRLFELWRLWDKVIKEENPQACFIANAGGGALSRLDMKTIGELAPTLFADRQARRGLAPPWTNGKNGKEYRATLGRKPIVGIFSVGVEEPYRWKDSVQTGNELRLWVADGTANGLRPWFTKFSGQVRDPRWLPVVEEIFEWHHAHERYLRNEDSLARVALVYSQQTATFYGGAQAHARVEDPTLGWYQALVEARVPFEMAHDRLLDAAHVRPFETLILPNLACLSTGQCEQLRAFVERGGNLVATYETSLYDEWGRRREDFALATLFGASWTGKREDRMQNSYLTVERDPLTGRYHPLLAGLEDAPRIINGVRRLETRPHRKPAYAPLTLVPSYPDLPMEEVYPRVPHTEVAMVHIAEHVSGGRVVYFPFDVDRTYWEVLSPDHYCLLRNAVRWVTRGAAPAEVTGPGLLDVTVWRQKDSLTVHLVNLTNPMTMKGPVREIYPAGPFEVSIPKPDRAVRGAKLLTAGLIPRIGERDGRLAVEVPKVGIHEVVAYDLG